MSREFTEQHVRGLCLLAGITVLNLWQIENQYWPDAYVEERKRSPWFLVKTPDGMVRIGWRKRVLSIEWSDTPIHLVVTEDSVTKDEQMVHAYSYSKAVEYLHRLADLMTRPAAVGTIGHVAPPGFGPATDALGVAVLAPLSDERILHLWDTHVAYQTDDSLALKDGDKIAFARAVLRADGVKGPDHG